MSQSTGRTPTRPRQVTVAGVMATVACLVLVITLFDSMASVRSTDMRGRVEHYLRTPTGAGLGLDAGSVVDLLRGLVLFSGALAAAGAVLAVYSLRRHRGARVGLSVTAGLMMVSATFVAGILPVVVVAAAAMLWGRDARDWFDGREPRPRARPSSVPERPSQQDLTSWPPPSGPGRPAPAPGPAPPPVDPGGQQPAVAYPPPRALHRPAGDPSRRPGTVTAAAWITWVFSALVVLAFGVLVLTILLQRERLLEELQKSPRVADQGFSARQILGFLWVLSAVSIFWALVAITLAALAFRRINAGRIGLVVSSAFAAVLCLVAVPVGWPHAAAAVACAVLLGRRSSRAWFAGQDLSGNPGMPPPRPPYEPPRDKPVW